uniref:Kinesin-like protein KIN-14N isoform X2 n=1 Tax=Cicer arietinum TaxID=3827 RepID=A0A1S3DZ56_CICAR|nr:kinesin-like protein KIN-14N isoform X2 [Cicer arietinum]
MTHILSIISKERCENMVDYIKRLKVYIRWFQDLEINYSLEQEKLKNSLEMTQQKSIEIELLLKIKEDELNSIIVEMRRNCSSLQEKFIKEEAEKSVVVAANDSSSINYIKAEARLRCSDPYEAPSCHEDTSHLLEGWIIKHFTSLWLNVGLGRV